MILVTGGAGYIGCHLVKSLLDLNYGVMVLDNLSTGHRGAVDGRALFINGELGDGQLLSRIFRTYFIESVVHLAANCYVGESVSDPLKYYFNNVSATIALLSKMVEHRVGKLVFSSTCAVYGTPDTEKIDETFSPNPVNPYGRSKHMIEQVVRDLAEVYKLHYICLRYFNAAGADPCGVNGEDHQPETHLIPNILFNLLGKKEKITVYGNDYTTRDGTCIRDYIHVNDLAEAHILALKSLAANKHTNQCYNLGSDVGFSVKEIIEWCEKVAGKKAQVDYGEKRRGDPPKLISASQKIYRDLGWRPQYSLQDIIETAWNWHSRCPGGYCDIGLKETIKFYDY